MLSSKYIQEIELDIRPGDYEYRQLSIVMDQILPKLGNKVLAESYKRYQNKYLPQCQTVEGYESPDFDIAAYPDYNDKLGKLEIYLSELKPYVKHLVRAAKLRQQYHEECIKNNKENNEDEGHTFSMSLYFSILRGFCYDLIRDGRY